MPILLKFIISKKLNISKEKFTKNNYLIYSEQADYVTTIKNFYQSTCAKLPIFSVYLNNMNCINRRNHFQVQIKSNLKFSTV